MWIIQHTRTKMYFNDDNEEFYCNRADASEYSSFTAAASIALTYDLSVEYVIEEE